MKFNVMNCEELKIQDKKTNETQILYKVTGFVNGIDIKNGLMQFYVTSPVDIECEYNSKLVVSNDMKTLKVVLENKIEGSKGIFNK